MKSKPLKLRATNWIELLFLFIQKQAKNLLPKELQLSNKELITKNCFLLYP